MTACSLPDCTRRHYALTFCKRHYRRFKVHNDPQKVGSTAKPLDAGLITAMYVDQQKTLAEIGAHFNVSPRHVLSELRKLNIPTRRAGHDGLRGESNPFWKGGIVEGGGYLCVLIPLDHPFASMRSQMGYVRRSRLVMAEHLGRPLLRSEVVHHRDHDKRNDSIENLELLQSQSEHMKEHMTTERAREMQRKQRAS